jgi:hypothetical protein
MPELLSLDPASEFGLNSPFWQKSKRSYIFKANPLLRGLEGDSPSGAGIN